jgi:hypothetical protein
VAYVGFMGGGSIKVRAGEVIPFSSFQAFSKSRDCFFKEVTMIINEGCANDIEVIQFTDKHGLGEYYCNQCMVNFSTAPERVIRHIETHRAGAWVTRIWSNGGNIPILRRMGFDEDDSEAHDS